MFFQYETPRLLLKVLRADCAPQVLDFYNRDKELFEMYEIDRVPDFLYCEAPAEGAQI